MFVCTLNWQHHGVLPSSRDLIIIDLDPGGQINRLVKEDLVIEERVTHYFC